MKSDARDAGARQMTKDEQIAQIKFYTQWMKDNGLYPEIWDTIDDLEKSLIEKIIADSEYNPL